MSSGQMLADDGAAADLLADRGARRLHLALAVAAVRRPIAGLAVDAAAAQPRAAQAAHRRLAQRGATVAVDVARLPGRATAGGRQHALSGGADVAATLSRACCTSSSPASTAPAGTWRSRRRTRASSTRPRGRRAGRRRRSPPDSCRRGRRWRSRRRETSSNHRARCTCRPRGRRPCSRRRRHSRSAPSSTPPSSRKRRRWVGTRRGSRTDRRGSRTDRARRPPRNPVDKRSRGTAPGPARGASRRVASLACRGCGALASRRSPWGTRRGNGERRRSRRRGRPPGLPLPSRPASPPRAAPRQAPPPGPDRSRCARPRAGRDDVRAAPRRRAHSASSPTARRDDRASCTRRPPRRAVRTRARPRRGGSRARCDKRADDSRAAAARPAR